MFVSEKTFLNKAIVVDQMFDPLREKQKSKEEPYNYNIGKVWFGGMFNVLERADLN